MLAAPAPRLAVPEEIAPEALHGFDRTAPLVDLDGQTMGTQWRVRMALPGGTSRDEVRRAVQDRLDGIVAQVSHWESTSLLSMFNHAAPGSWAPLPADFDCIMQAALRIAEASGGAFNPAVGRLTDIWGLGPNAAEHEPTASAIADALAHSDWRHLALEASPPRLRQPGGIWLDLSGIAKGHAVDAAAQTLATMGILHALVEVGGEFVGRGLRPDGDPWWVELETPPSHTQPVSRIAPLRVALCQLAVATSGDYLRGAHTLDPVTGLPAIHDTTAVSVIHANCMEADAWATALSVLPVQRAQDMATRWRLATRLLLRDGSEWLSPALTAML